MVKLEASEFESGLAYYPLGNLSNSCCKKTFGQLYFLLFQIAYGGKVKNLRA